MIMRLKIRPYHFAKACPFCLMNSSLGYTTHGIAGCLSCQKTVDDYMLNNYKVVRE